MRQINSSAGGAEAQGVEESASKEGRKEMRIAIIQVGPYKAVFDGRRFRSADKGLARILNSALNRYWRVGRYMFGEDAPGYWPDQLRGLAEAMAKYHGGELVSCDPIDYSKFPEGAVF